MGFKWILCVSVAWSYWHCYCCASAFRLCSTIHFGSLLFFLFFPFLNNCLVIMQIRTQTKRESKIENEIHWIRASKSQWNIVRNCSNCRTFNVRLHESRNISPSYYLDFGSIFLLLLFRLTTFFSPLFLGFIFILCLSIVMPFQQSTASTFA